MVTERHCGEYLLSDDISRVDFPAVHGWLTKSYWSPGISFERVEKAASLSPLVVGAYLGDEQVGYMRALGDKTTFAWLCDVFVAEGHRGKGLGKALVRFATEHPEWQGLRRWVLATKDAHGVYRECGFQSLPEPDRFMILLPDG